MALRRPLYFDTVDQINKEITPSDDVELNNLTLGGILSATGIDLNNGALQNLADPTLDTDAATKGYVDATISATPKDSIRVTLTSESNVLPGAPVYINAANTVGRAFATAVSPFARRVIGVAVNTSTGGNPVEVVLHGILPGVLSGATPGMLYWLDVLGGLTITPPDANRVRVGYALNSTDLFVHIQDYGTDPYVAVPEIVGPLDPPISTDILPDFSQPIDPTGASGSFVGTTGYKYGGPLNVYTGAGTSLTLSGGKAILNGAVVKYNIFGDSDPLDLNVGFSMAGTMSHVGARFQPCRLLSISNFNEANSLYSVYNNYGVFSLVNGYGTSQFASQTITPVPTVSTIKTFILTVGIQGGQAISKLYLDGVLITQTIGTPNVPAQATTLNFGSSGGAVVTLWKVCAFKRQLTSSEVGKLHPWLADPDIVP